MRGQEASNGTDRDSFGKASTLKAQVNFLWILRDWLKGIPLNAFSTLLACLWEFIAEWNFFWKQSVDELYKFDTDVDCRHAERFMILNYIIVRIFLLWLVSYISRSFKILFLILLVLFYYCLYMFFLIVYLYNLYWHPVRPAFPKRSSDRLKNIPQIQLVTPPPLPKNNLVLLMCPRQHAKERFEKLQGCVTHMTSTSPWIVRLERIFFFGIKVS